MNNELLRYLQLPDRLTSLLSPIFADWGFSFEPAETLERGKYSTYVRRYTLPRISKEEWTNFESLSTVAGIVAPSVRCPPRRPTCGMRLKLEAKSTLFVFLENVDAPRVHAALHRRKLLGRHQRSDGLESGPRRRQNCHYYLRDIRLGNVIVDDKNFIQEMLGKYNLIGNR
jgi:hypothetical protein